MKPTTTKPDVKEVMQPHSQAKVEFYGNYLSRYLRILYKSQFISRINIFDVFCGMGIYPDGGKGSPIVAFDIIQKVFEENKQIRKVQFIVNDADDSRVDNVKSYVIPRNSETPCCEFRSFNMDAETMLEYILTYVSRTDSKTRNLIFIDPYGYRQIKKELLEKLMSNKKTEILLFLPISHMYRFSRYAVGNENRTSHQPLRDFVNSFFSDDHPIVRGDNIDVMDYIAYLRSALNFGGRYYTTSYHIERNRGSYFALFFLTSNLLGYERTLGVKWDLDTKDGNGFEQPEQMESLFADEEKARARENMELKLRKLLMQYLLNPRTNKDVYEYILVQEFLPKQANKILSELQKRNLITVEDLTNGKNAPQGAFYLSYNHCKKDRDPKIQIRLIHE